MRLSHVCIITDDLERLTDFYQRVLQMEPQIFRGEYVEFAADEPGAILSLYRLESHEKIAPGSMEAALNHSLEVEFVVADVDQEYARLREVVSNWVMPPTNLPWGQRSTYFRDPDGNLVNFYSRIEEQT